MSKPLRHLHGCELGFLGLVGLTALVILLHLRGTGLGRVELPGGGWRAVDREGLERRIERGDLRDCGPTSSPQALSLKEADFYRPHDLAG